MVYQTKIPDDEFGCTMDWTKVIDPFGKECDADYLDPPEISAEGYIYGNLTPQQEKALEFSKSLSAEEQIEILYRTRDAMRQQGLPKPRQWDLARAVASDLCLTEGSARTLIANLDKSLRANLDLRGYPPVKRPP